MMSVGGLLALLSAPSTTPAPPTTAVTTVLVSKPTSPSSVLTTIGNTIVQLHGASVPSFWSTWLAPLVTLAVGIYAAYLLRKTGRGTVTAAADSAKASQRAADASAESARVAGDSVLASRATAKELDEWRQREETMRMLRWAADHAIKFNSPGESEMGQATLDALQAADLLQPRDSAFVAAVGRSIVKPQEAEYDEGDEYQVDDDQEPL